MRELITHEELMRILAAIQSEQKPSQATLQAAAENQSRRPVKLPDPIDLEIWVDPDSSDTVLCLTGGEKWKGALVQCQWNTVAKPSTNEEAAKSVQTAEPVHIFLLMPQKASNGQCQAVVTLEQLWLETIPAVARIVPRYADPEILRSRLQSAALKPSAKELIDWIDANLGELEGTQHRDKWTTFRKELEEGKCL